MAAPTSMGIPNSVLPGTAYLDVTRFDTAITGLGVNTQWRKSHICPCGSINGSPDPQCLNCGGWGRYWDAPSASFISSISFSVPDDPSMRTNQDIGSYFNALPLLTIPQIAGAVWDNATVYDQFILPDSVLRVTTNLLNSEFETIPFSYGVTIPVSGAVQVYDINAHTIAPDNNYTVTVTNGVTKVHLTDQVDGTPFSVEYTAYQSYVAYARGSVPHVRPEVGGLRLPRRFQLQPLDIWLRGHSGTGNP